ncbi:MAG: DUF3800 domain-containing protein [Terracidiphilus sp.]
MTEGLQEISKAFNIYCDESCHLEHDGLGIMVIGAVWCSTLRASGHARNLRSLKVKHGLSPTFEIKWTKVSESKVGFYLDLLEHFFADDDLHFRGLLVADKNKLDHENFRQTHDEWYYKMYFDMLKTVISPTGKYHVYVDIKDTWGSRRVAHLHDVICNSMYDFSREILERIQIMRSDESELLQLADVLIGAVGYAARDLKGNRGKVRLVEFIRQQTGYSLARSTLYREEKFNLLRWAPWEMR